MEGQECESIHAKRGLIHIWGEQGVSLLHTIPSSTPPLQIIRETCRAAGLDDPRHFLLRRYPVARAVVFPAEDLSQTENLYMFNCNKQASESGIVKIEPLSRVILARERWIYWREKRLHVQFPWGHDQDAKVCKFIRKYISPDFELYQSATLFCKETSGLSFAFIVTELESSGECAREVVFFNGDSVLLYNAVVDIERRVPSEEYPQYLEPYKIYKFREFANIQ